MKHFRLEFKKQTLRYSIPMAVTAGFILLNLDFFAGLGQMALITSGFVSLALLICSSLAVLIWMQEKISGFNYLENSRDEMFQIASMRSAAAFKSWYIISPTVVVIALPFLRVDVSTALYTASGLNLAAAFILEPLLLRRILTQGVN